MGLLQDAKAGKRRAKKAVPVSGVSGEGERGRRPLSLIGRQPLCTYYNAQERTNLASGCGPRSLGRERGTAPNFLGRGGALPSIVLLYVTERGKKSSLKGRCSLPSPLSFFSTCPSLLLLLSSLFWPVSVFGVWGFLIPWRGGVEEADSERRRRRRGTF